MYKIRIRFKKTGNMKFISHLDLMRMMERALRRANIPLTFSQGFNPHPKIVFATALPIGVSSEGEYMDIEIEETVNLQSFKNNMNAELPEGISIIQCKYVDPKAKALMAVIEYSSYIIKCQLEFDMNFHSLKLEIDKFIDNEEIIVLKTLYKRNQEINKEINIRTMIRNIEIIDKKDLQIYLKVIIGTGSKGNLKPEVLIEQIKKMTNIPIILDSIRIHRLDLYLMQGDRLITPMEMIT